MPVRQNAGFGICREIRLQPGPLSTAGGHIYFRIQGVDAPGTQVVGIVSGRIIKVLEVACCARRSIFMVARNRFGSRLVTSPGWVVTVCVLRNCAAVIGIISRSKNGARDTVQQFCDCLIIVVILSLYVL